MDLGNLGMVPPQSIASEQSVLGSMLLDKEAISIAAGILKPEDFYRDDHKEIFKAIMDLFGEALPADIITVHEKVKQFGIELEYLSDIASDVPTTSNIKHYSKIVEEKSILRKLIIATSEISKESFEYGEDVSLILDNAEKKIFSIMQNRNLREVVQVKDLMVDAFSRIEDLYNSSDTKGITGIPTGFIDLDQKTSGLQDSDFILVAARPAMGKTSFSLNIAQYAAIHHKIPVAVFSLEMSKEQLINRIIFSESLVDSQKARTGKLTDEDWGRLAKSIGPLHEAPIYIDDTPAASIVEISSKARRLKIDKNIGLIVIDYLQLINGKRTENRQQEISDISRSLKVLAKEINVPVIALSQLSRAPEQRADHRPILSDLRESGAIEQDADIVMFLYRDDYYNPDTEKKNIAEVIISKHRNGSTGTVELAWLGPYTKFANLERRK